MADLERELRALAAQVELPPTPDLAARVRARLGERPRAARPLRVLVVALAVVALALGAAFAVPQSRGAILRWLGLRGVKIEFVDRLPAVPLRSTIPIGPRLSLDDASRRAGFRVLTSSLLGPPDEVHFDGYQVWLVYGRRARPRLLLSEFRGGQRPEFVKKLVEPQTRVSFVTVEGNPGYFLSGAEHFLYVAPAGYIREERIRLARDTLLWQHGELTLRLEGDLTQAQALRIARSLR